ncbi:MAG: hypothetical protein QY307_08920 [Acidimicrobiia bacterium]|nr:MAG: hypothetical protein QY307_08920 [Acidimicrobiia bacterium]
MPPVTVVGKKKQTGDTVLQRLASFRGGDEEEGASKDSADALSAAHGRDVVEKSPGVTPVDRDHGE